MPADIYPFVNLMKIEPSFHQVRRYMTPMKYKGREILSHVGDCKQSGCKWNKTFANREGLALGVWKHRKEHILERRTELAVQTFRRTPNKVASAMSRAADNQTHTEEQWIAEVTGLFTDKQKGAELVKRNGPRLLTYYAIGMLAIQACHQLLVTLTKDLADV